MTTDATERLLTALRNRGAKIRGDGRDRYRAQCPAHDGADLNLAIAKGDQGALLRCWSHGCTEAEVARAVGLEPRDLFDVDGRAVYNYAGGHQVIRTRTSSGKAIRQVNAPPVTSLYTPPGSESIASSAVVLLAEGEKTADALVRMGAGCVATWPGGSNAVARVDLSALNGKRVRIVPDNDEPGSKALLALAGRLSGVVADLGVWRVPAELNGEALNDAADLWLAGGTLDDLTTEPAPVPPPANEAETTEQIAQFATDDGNGRKERVDALAIAQAIAPGLGRGADRALYVYSGGIYERDDAVVTKRTAATLGARYTRLIAGQVTDHLSNIDLPTVGVQQLPSGHLPHIVLENGVYHWAEHELRAHDPAYGALTKCPIVWDADAASPVFDRWLQQVVGDDDDTARHVLEVLGYMLMTGNPLQKMFLIVGAGGNGKGTFLRLVQRLIGEANFSAVSLHDLARDQYARAELFGKLANISGDLSAKFLQDPEPLKMVTGGDQITCHRKFGQPFTFQPYAVPIFAANELFRSSDTSEGWRRRWEVIPFTRNVIGSGPFNEAELFAELPGIFNRAMDGLRRLMARGKFAPSETARASTDDLHRASNLAEVWLDEDDAVTVSEHEQVEKARAYERFRGWCTRNGHRDVSSATFGRLLKETLGAALREVRTGVDGARVRCYIGLGISD